MGKILNNLNEKFSSSGDLISESIKNIDLNLGGGDSKPLYPIIKIRIEFNSETRKKVILSFEFIEGIVPLDIADAKLIVIEETEYPNGTFTQSSNALLCHKENEETGAPELDIFALNNYRFELSQDKKTVVGVNQVRYDLQSIFDAEYETQTVSNMWIIDTGWSHDYIILYNDSHVETERIKYDYVMGEPERWYRDNDRDFYSFRVADGLGHQQITVIYPNKHDPNDYVEFDNGDVL